jgi:hypothetical protein
MKPPRQGRRAGAARVEPPTGVGHEGTPDQSKFLHSGDESGCLFVAISLGLLQALILSLRIADGLCQHLAQLSLGLLRRARRFPLGCILGHARYMGMTGCELNPYLALKSDLIIARCEMTRWANRRHQCVLLNHLVGSAEQRRRHG